MSTVDPSLIEELQNGNLLALGQYIDTSPASIKQLPLLDLFSILRASIEGNIHPTVFKMLVSGDDIDRERENDLLKLTLRNNNNSMAWMILNRWKQFEKLDISNCNLTSIPSIPVRHCEKLKELNISSNKLEILSLLPDKFPCLKQVHFQNNPLSIYSEKSKHSWSKMKEYLHSVDNRCTNAIYKKLVIIGDSYSGKTLLLESLQKIYGKGDSIAMKGDYINTTQISVDTESGKKIYLNVWDVKGEGSPLRNFFITSRAIYILCFNINSSSYDESICYWLQLIQSLCKVSTATSTPSQNDLITPVFIVGTGDDKSQYTPGHLDSLDDHMRHLVSKTVFRGYRGTYFVTKSGKGVKTLLKDISLLINDQIGSRYGISSSWILLTDCLDRMKKDNKISYVDWSTFKTLSEKCGIKDSVMQSCTLHLREIGTLLLYFSASGFWNTRSIIILDPQWLCNILLRIFNDKKYISNGLFVDSNIPELFSGYPTAITDFIFNLLKQYNFIHKLNAKQYLIPNLLSKACPFSELRKHWSAVATENEFEHQRIFEFSFLPLEFFSRVIVRILQVDGMIGVLYWKNGVLFKLISQNCIQKCIITYDEINYKLLIRMRVSNESYPSQRKSRGMLFRHVIEVVETLLECYYPRLVENTKRLIPCTHCLCFSGVTPFMFTYSECIEAVTSGISYLFCNHIPSPSRQVVLYKLAPDIAFADLSHIKESDLIVGDVIGEGSFGSIHKGTLSGKPVAIKTLKASNGEDEEERHVFWEFQQESCIMSGLEHSNIVKLFGVTANPPRIVMELLLGDLFNWIHPKGCIEENTTRVPNLSNKYSWKLKMRIAYDIARGMQYLQNIRPPIIHRDLRSPNIFLVSLDENSPICAKVADFGLSRSITTGISGCLNSWQWLAPEVIIEDGGEYDLSSDVYSFGIIFWEILTFLFPYDEFLTNSRYARTFVDGNHNNHNNNIDYINIVNKLGNGDDIVLINPGDIKSGILHEGLRPTIPNECPTDIADLIERCWDINPKNRPKFDEIVYILSLELKIQLDDINFTRESFSRKNISVDLSSIILPRNVSVPSEPRYTRFSRFFETKNYFVSCMILIQECNEVWMGTSAGLIVIRNAKNGDDIFSIDVHSQRITSIKQFNQQVWTSSADGTISIINTSSRQRRACIKNPEEGFPIKCLCCVKINDNKSQIWSSSPRSKKIHCWDVNSYTLLRSIDISLAVHAMVQCNDYVWLSIEEGTITLIHCETLQPLGSFIGSSKTVGHFYTFDNCIWGGSDNGTLTTWIFDAECKEIDQLTVSNAHLSSITSINKIKNLIWTSSNDRSIILWDSQTFQPLVELPEVHKDVILCSLSIGSDTVWTASADGIVGIWNINSPQLLTSLTKSTSVTKLDEKKPGFVTRASSLPLEVKKENFKKAKRITLCVPSPKSEMSIVDMVSPNTNRSGSRRMKRVTSIIGKRFL